MKDKTICDVNVLIIKFLNQRPNLIRTISLSAFHEICKHPSFMIYLHTNRASQTFPFAFAASKAWIYLVKHGYETSEHVQGEEDSTVIDLLRNQSVDFQEG